jgi:hypothetical protein
MTRRATRLDAATALGDHRPMLTPATQTFDCVE